MLADHVSEGGGVVFVGMHKSDYVYAKNLIDVLKMKHTAKAYKKRYMADYLEEFDTCLEDLYSISWMVNCDKKDLHKETLGEQYEEAKIEFVTDTWAVRKRTPDGTNGIDKFGYDVMQYVMTYEDHCRPLSRYGIKYTRAVANMCNIGFTANQMIAALVKTCIQNNL
ncbi:hypothetical protein FNV43_RR10967 [Rhamnella rubrinervis]|uniref:Legumain prodomain domain-containing protein n=1 Tax=Rhamnella rubrinervis TaxID=2594499 RepID=A0A8K0MHE6_9ROSA|nr:hypothetical protein FNV43_RR10967 [Rhamnella rubrinervis]